jgi:hypothetical protein
LKLFPFLAFFAALREDFFFKSGFLLRFLIRIICVYLRPILLSTICAVSLAITSSSFVGTHSTLTLES